MLSGADGALRGKTRHWWQYPYSFCTRTAGSCTWEPAGNHGYARIAWAIGFASASGQGIGSAASAFSYLRVGGQSIASAFPQHPTWAGAGLQDYKTAIRVLALSFAWGVYRRQRCRFCRKMSIAARGPGDGADARAP